MRASVSRDLAIPRFGRRVLVTQTQKTLYKRRMNKCRNSYR
jgi:hypothetical protein